MGLRIKNTISQMSEWGVIRKSIISVNFAYGQANITKEEKKCVY